MKSKWRGVGGKYSRCICVCVSVCLVRIVEAPNFVCIGVCIHTMYLYQKKSGEFLFFLVKFDNIILLERNRLYFLNIRFYSNRSHFISVKNDKYLTGIIFVKYIFYNCFLSNGYHLRKN